MVAPPPLPAPGPTPPATRDPAMDTVRGFAVLGLVFANVTFFASADYYREWAGPVTAPTGLDAAARWMVEFFLVGKCVTLLSFLLGAGLALLQRRATATGASFPRLALRRMFALFGIGVAHALLLWWGDILCFYALLGAGVVLLAPLPARAIRWVAFTFMGATVALLALGFGVMSTFSPADPVAGAESLIALVDRTYRDGSWLQLFLVRLLEIPLNQMNLLVFAPFSLGVVMLGYDAIRSGWYPRPGPLPPGFVALATAGVLLSAINAFFTTFARGDADTYFVMILAGMPGSLGLAALYLVMLPRIVPHGLLAPVGRTALSNYLLQSLLLTLVFTGVGLGFHGSLGFASQTAIAAGIALLGLLWSPLWLRRFRFGPAEMLWRRLAYSGQVSPPNGMQPASSRSDS